MKITKELMVAIATVGYTPEWAGGCSSRPDLFKREVSRRRTGPLAFLVSPDTGRHGFLARHSAEINAAYDLIDGADEEALAEAMRASHAQASEGKIEKLAEILAKLREGEEAKEELLITKAKLLINEEVLSSVKSDEYLSELKGYVASHAQITGSLEKDKYFLKTIKSGDRITISDLIGKIILTPVEIVEVDIEPEELKGEKSNNTKELIVSVCPLMIDSDGETLRLNPEEFYFLEDIGTPVSVAKDKLYRLCGEQLDQYPHDFHALPKQMSSVVGFITNESVSESSDSLFSFPIDHKPTNFLTTTPARLLKACKESLLISVEYQKYNTVEIGEGLNRIALVVIDPMPDDAGKVSYALVPIDDFFPSREERRRNIVKAS